jgi:phenylalanine-4-hydroxylase
MVAAAPHVPAHLRAFVVEQDYERYSAVDHAVWRFVLLQMRSRLADTAHPAYRQGLAATGISIDRIPSIAQMNDCLGRFGWAAVCVDGFIPPRVFQEFQASAILPIAADIRRREHLVYTPAPDIIHEAAGHAPILPDPVFSSYLRRIGDLGRQAFTLPEEDAVFRAIHELSEIKERPGADPADVSRAESSLEAAIAAAAEPSEATRLSRLYWWTAEYGLVGRPDDYALYGAGLLSSLGESQSCHDPAVRKLPLDERCMEVAYDITRPQPRLYVVPRFEALHDVLDRAAATLAVRLGGAVALDRALRSREVASFAFASGAWATGVLTSAGPSLSAPAWIDLTGRVSCWWGAAPPVAPFETHSALCVFCGPLEGGEHLEATSGETIARRLESATGRHDLRFALGARIEGRVDRVVRRTDGRIAYIDWSEALLTRPGAEAREVSRFRMLVAGEFVSARAGAVDPSYHPDTPFSSTRVPSAVAADAGSARLLELYERAEHAHRSGPEAVAVTFPAVHAALERDYPHEWLLRWNLLESLLKTRRDGALASALRAELEGLEVRFDHREPIASGLRFLSRVAA